MKTPLATPAARDAALLLARAVTGGILAHGAWGVATSPARMAGFARLLAAHLPLASLAGLVLVYAQLLAALLLAFGLATRWAALFLSAIFAVGWVVAQRGQPVLAQWPALAFVLVGLLVASHGAGRWSLDRLMGVK